MELKDTVENMLSDDYKKRFRAEYDQLMIRRGKLEAILANWDNLDFEPSCPKRVLQEQATLFTRLMYLYQERAKCEGIEL